MVDDKTDQLGFGVDKGEIVTARQFGPRFGEVRAEMSATAFFPPQRGNGDELGGDQTIAHLSADRLRLNRGNHLKRPNEAPAITDDSDMIGHRVAKLGHIAGVVRLA